MGRHAHSAAALLVAVGASAAIGLGVAVVLVGQGLALEGSALLGAGFTLIGVVFAAVALLAAQVTERARVAAGTAGAVIATTFLLRAVGDVGKSALSWASPFGWIQATRPFVDDRWWPLGRPSGALGGWRGPFSEALLVGVAVALYGLAPRAIPVVWAVLGVCTFVGVLADGLDLPPWVRDLSPFAHSPTCPLCPPSDSTSCPSRCSAPSRRSWWWRGFTGFSRRDLA